MRARAVAACCAASAALTCAPIATSGPGCTELTAPTVLSRELVETSGIAVGRRNPDILWTHNDGDSDLYALDRDGRVVARFDVPVRMRDWEDLEIARCPEAGSCLYLADTGDNGERRRAGSIRIVRVAEPLVSDGAEDRPTLEADVFPIALPDGPRDVEALFVLPDGAPYLVTKGGSAPVSVYRYPGSLRPDTVVLEEVQQLSDGPQGLLDRVTGASASPDGSWVAIRTYQALEFYRVEAGRLAHVDGGLANLRSLAEIQGEAVGIGMEGVVALTSEGGPLGGPPSMRILRCRLEDA
ncbi:MAG: hypothetical protein PVJ80_04430 [Gemmatimonadota bacterium]